jgi:predicted Zn-dependent protease
VVDYSRSLGVKYSEARYQLDKYFTIILRNGKLVTLGTSINDGVGIRLVYDNVLTFSATNKLGRDELVGIVRDAVSRARATTHLVKTPTRFSDDVVSRGSYEVIPYLRTSTP